jgi:predicted nuclease of predicted toxin-antitoxin system
MAILIDQNLPIRTAQLLRAHGWDAVHVDEVDSRLTDRAILDWAAREGRICVTRDSDFHAILSVSKLKKPSVIRLRMETLSFADAAEIIERVCSLLAEPLDTGAMVTVTRERVRFRRLPLAE